MRLALPVIGIAVLGLFQTHAFSRPSPSPWADDIAQLRTVADQLQIQRLIADYSAFLASRDFDAYGALFAHGAFLGPNGEVAACGSTQVADLARRYLGGNSDVVVRHLVTNVRINVARDGRTATAESFLTTIQAPKSAPAYVFRIAEYNDRFRKLDNSWTFTSRQEKTLWVLNERQPIPSEPRNPSGTSRAAPAGDCSP